MQIRNGDYLFSPSDLIGYLECPFRSWLDRYDLEFPGQLQRDPETEEEHLLRASGDRHERAHFESLSAVGDVCDLRGQRSMGATKAAMDRGERLIYQAPLEDGSFYGIADFLVRIQGRSLLGDYLYEVWDTKLARKTKPYHAIQICCYSEMLERIQGVEAELGGIILGNGKEQSIALSDYRHYYRALKNAFLEMQRTFDPNAPMEIPVRGNFGHWTGYVERIREERDDLSRVAGIRVSQIRRLCESGVRTLTHLVQSERPSLPGIAQATYERLRLQAEHQLLSAGLETPLYRVLSVDPNQPRLGLASLPPASPGDVFFDMEGYPLVDEGLEYLFGASYEEGGLRRFSDWWAHTREEEKTAFESFIRWVYSRWRSDPGMHIYHYADYERSAVQRLSIRFSTCQTEVDDLLRNEVFVDLYQVVRQGLVIGDSSYSLKNVERLYLPPRQGEVATASGSIVYYGRWLDHQDGSNISESHLLQMIRDYNREDCDSTMELAAWLRDRQKEKAIQYVPAPIGDGPSEERTARAAFAEEMLRQSEEIEDPEVQRIHQLLAQLVEFHRREAKPMWWAYFDRLKKSDQQLLEDAECLAGLCSEGGRERYKQSYRYTYRFPRQETKIREGKTCVVASDPSIKIEVESIDFDQGLLTFKRGVRIPAPPERLTLIPYENVPCRDVEESILTLAQDYSETRELPSALGDFLSRRTPNLGAEPLVHLANSCPDRTSLAVEAVRAMRETCLVIQGPPGCGKTYTAGRMIAELMRSGARVGVMSNSHRAIGLVLREAVEVCRNAGIACDAANVDGDEEAEIPGVTRVNSGTSLEGLAAIPALVGGTAWVFARPGLIGHFDYLFIDEAGQVSVANLVGVSRCARNLVIIGDQRQLNQPMQGSHPGESGRSILEYYLSDKPAISADQGILLDTTFRMRPELCSFISDSIYGGRLSYADVTRNRRLIPATAGHGRLQRLSGLLFVPVSHQDNSYESREEADQAEAICHELLGMRYEDETGQTRHLRQEDILVVSPYNLQVLLLRRRLPAGIRVGTVDKFQGQQAPVVIYSMATSSGEDCARGIEFLFSPNRLNVALSRAKVLAILLSSDRLARTDCRSLEQIRLVNLFCRAADAGTVTGAAVAAGSVLPY